MSSGLYHIIVNQMRYLKDNKKSRRRCVSQGGTKTPSLDAIVERMTVLRIEAFFVSK